jgi:hypothetical protein
MVHDVKAFRAELEVDLFVDGEDLADRGIEVPCSRPTECIAGGHRRREGTPVGCTQQVRISKRVGVRKVADRVEIGSIGCSSTRDLLEGVLRNNAGGRGVPSNVVARCIVGEIEVGERRAGPDSVDTRDLPASSDLVEQP